MRPICYSIVICWSCVWSKNGRSLSSSLAQQCFSIKKTALRTNDIKIWRAINQSYRIIQTFNVRWTWKNFSHKNAVLMMRLTDQSYITCHVLVRLFILTVQDFLPISDNSASFSSNIGSIYINKIWLSQELYKIIVYPCMHQKFHHLMRQSESNPEKHRTQSNTKSWSTSRDPRQVKLIVPYDSLEALGTLQVHQLLQLYRSDKNSSVYGDYDWHIWVDW